MMNFLKFLPLVLRFKDIYEAYRNEVGEGRPWYLARRFIGVVMATIGAGVAIFSGVTLDSGVLDSITESILSLIGSGVTLYGLILTVVGIVRRKPA